MKLAVVPRSVERQAPKASGPSVISSYLFPGIFGVCVPSYPLFTSFCFQPFLTGRQDTLPTISTRSLHTPYISSDFSHSTSGFAFRSRSPGREGNSALDNLGYAPSRGQNLVAGQSKQTGLAPQNHSLTPLSCPTCNRWTSKHCLHVSASSPAPATDTPPAPTQLTSDSYIETHPLPNPSSSFTTAYAMLLYNVCYLTHTQGVEVPLSQAGDVLSNLWSVCCSAELGRSAHFTHSVPMRATDQ